MPALDQAIDLAAKTPGKPLQIHGQSMFVLRFPAIWAEIVGIL